MAKFDKAPKGVNAVVEETSCVCDEASTDEIILFATKTCPNCRMAEKFLGDAGISFRKVYADDEPALTKQFGVTGAPTLVVIKEGVAEKIANVSNIRKFADASK